MKPATAKQKDKPLLETFNIEEWGAVIGRFTPIGDMWGRMNPRDAANLKEDGQPLCQYIKLERIGRRK